MINEIFSISDATVRDERIIEYSTRCINDNNATELQLVFEHLFGSTYPAERIPLILPIVLARIEECVNDELIESVCNNLLSTIVTFSNGRFIDSFDFKIRVILFKVFVSQADYSKAALTLSSVRSNSLSSSENLYVLLKSAQYYLKDENEANADKFIRRAGELIAQLKSASTEAVEKEYLLLYYSISGQLFELRGRFLEALHRYMELCSSDNVAEMVQPEDLVFFYIQALLCIFYLPKSNFKLQLTSLLKLKTTMKSFFAFLPAIFQSLERKIQYSQIITPQEASLIVPHLSPSHLVLTSDFIRLFDKVIYEHNIFCLFQTYTSISIDRLSQILNVSDKNLVEKILTKMVYDRKLPFNIRLDQETNLVSVANIDVPAIEFKDEIIQFARKRLEHDKKVNRVCQLIEGISNKIAEAKQEESNLA
jgi:PCI domain